MTTADDRTLPPTGDARADGGVRIERRPLTRNEGLLIVEAIRSSTTITGYSLAEWCGRRDVLAAVDPRSGELLGAALIHHLIGGWSEVAVLFVMGDHRGAGLGSDLLAGAVASARGRRLLLFFCEERMRRMARRAGFEVHETPSAFVGRSPSRRLFLGFLYPVQWGATRYRRAEIRRKREMYECSFEFSLATLDLRYTDPKEHS